MGQAFVERGQAPDTSNDCVIDVARESILERCARVLRNDGIGGFVTKGFRTLVMMLEPLKVVYYPYVRWKLPKEVAEDYSAEAAVRFALHRFGGFIRPTQIEMEISSLAKIVERLKPRTVLEIGTSKGGTLFIWSRLAAKDAHLVSVDMPGGENNWAYPTWKQPLYRKFASRSQTIDLLRGNSQSEEMLATVKEVLRGEKVEFLFIDADHTYEGVKKDYTLYAPLVRSGGVIAFHDIATHRLITNCRVKQLWDEIKPGTQSLEFVESPTQKWGGIGVLFVQ
jgi:predicted O-methyltransferase YrrM